MKNYSLTTVISLLILLLTTACTKKYINQYEFIEFAEGSGKIPTEQLEHICHARAKNAGELAEAQVRAARNNAVNCYETYSGVTCEQGEPIRGGSFSSGFLSGMAKRMGEINARDDARSKAYDLCVAEHGYKVVWKKVLNPKYVEKYGTPE